MENEDQYIGKVVERIESGETFLIIRFTDGTKIEVVANSVTEDGWLEYRQNSK